MNVYLIVILSILLGEYLLDLIVDALNLKAVSNVLPEEFQGFYDAEKYARSQEYLRKLTGFGLVKRTMIILVTLVFILAGGFDLVDTLVRSISQDPVIAGLLFAAILMFVFSLVSIPFSAYRTFVIEAKFGFNRTTPKTFIFDIAKSWMISAVIGGILFSGIIWFFLKVSFAWVWCWAAVNLFQFFLIFIAPVVILPLFNKFLPLENDQLKEAIREYARSQKFGLAGIYKIDGSRRSTKSNAYFTGFGRYRRIALFDTLIEKHTVSELVSVLAHEIGHYKKRHILKSRALGILASALMFFLLSLFINNPGLFQAFKMQHLSIYASLFFFGFLYSPVSLIFSVLGNILSRKHEYEADRFVVDTFSDPKAFITALKRLSVDNLSNLTPHPLKVFLDYTHPPVLKRVKAVARCLTE